jgi:hypothetical protein
MGTRTWIDQKLLGSLQTVSIPRQEDAAQMLTPSDVMILVASDAAACIVFSDDK